MHSYVYTFGFENGVTPEAASFIWAEKKLDILFGQYLRPEDMEAWRLRKLYRTAISMVVDEIMR